MKIWAISDTHLPGVTGRTMEYHGRVWNDHAGKIVQNWNRLVDSDDIVLIGGDITWSYELGKALVDLKRLADLPGKYKIIIKGNHDSWWKQLLPTAQALPKSIVAMEGSAVKIGGQVICGTCGWLAPNDPYFDRLDRKTFEKELQLLQRSLDAALALHPAAGIHVLLHFPPFTAMGIKTRFFTLLRNYPIYSCTYGHFHKREEWRKIPNGKVEGIFCRLTSSDYLNHTPALIWDDAASAH